MEGVCFLKGLFLCISNAGSGLFGVQGHQGTWAVWPGRIDNTCILKPELGFGEHECEGGFAMGSWEPRVANESQR